MAHLTGAGERTAIDGAVKGAVHGGSFTRVSHPAKRCIFIGLLGAPSQHDMFWHKPELQARDGESLPEELLKKHRFPGGAAAPARVRLMASPYKFQQHGSSGLYFSELLPHLARRADDIAIIHTMHSPQITHAPAQLLTMTGFPRQNRPSIGAWVAYGLGAESQNLPAFVVLWSGISTYSLSSLWSNGVLPGECAGVQMHTYSSEPLSRLTPPSGVTMTDQRRSLDAIRRLNELRLDQLRKNQQSEPDIESRIHAYELAFRLQSAAPEAADLRGESPSVLAAYGVNRESARASEFAKHCLFARRLIERGVRFVNLFNSSWDHHDDIFQNLPKRCLDVDQPIAALIADLKARGLLDDTLVVWATEFGRTPFAQVRLTEPGRDHHRLAFPIWMAGAGVKAGFEHGETDDFGWEPIGPSYDLNDMQATLLHLLGIDHTRLTVRHNGRDLRLTDVGGRVIESILA
ncbi:MAG: DUF1501 domain-containing protein [Pirellulales bacterium]